MRKKYEYFTMTHSDGILMDQLNSLADFGWRVVTVIPGKLSHTIIFERERNDNLLKG